MSAHTPGPWEWVGDSLESHSDYVLGIGDDGKQFGLHSPILIESSWATRAEANRYLIAAAPELLLALQEALFLIEQECADGSHTTEAINARAAIAKATGSAT
jgi:hypothetical protein